MRRPRANVQQTDFGDRRRFVKIIHEAGRGFGQLPIRRFTVCGELRHHRRVVCIHFARTAEQAATGLDQAGRAHADFVGRRFRVAVFVIQHFALLGEFDLAVYGAGWLRQNRFVRGSAAPPDRAAATVEQSAIHLVATRDCNNVELRLIQIPVRRKNAAVFARVGITEHDFLQIAAAAEQGAIYGIAEKRFKHGFGVAQIADRLKQRRNADFAKPALAGVAAQACQPGQKTHFEHVRRGMRHRNHIRTERGFAHFGLQLGHALEYRERLARFVTQPCRIDVERIHPRDPAGEALHARGFIGGRVIKIGVELRENLGRGARVHGGLLPHVELQ